MRTGTTGSWICPFLAVAGLAVTFEAVSAHPSPAVPLNGVYAAEYFDIRSEAVGETYRIFVAMPMTVQPDTKYPVVYALDGNASFGTVREMARLMSIGGELPPAIVVGIGYAIDDSFRAAMVKRYRDYSPTKGGIVERTVQRTSDPTLSVQPGGGPVFLDFLRDELKPVIESRYPADPTDATLGGASLGGLFPAWVLLHEPEVFQRYVLISPSIWWNREEVWQWEEAYAARHDDLEATVFVTAGGLETIGGLKESVAAFRAPGNPMKEAIEETIAVYDEYGWPRMAEITPEFTDRLRSRKYPGLKIYTHNLPDETHLSVPAGAWSRGLRYVFGHWVPE